MKKLRNNKIRKLLAFMVALALMVSCMPSAYTISASEAFGDGTEDIFTDGEITSEPAAEESTPDVSSADQEETEQAQQSTLTYENDSVKVTAEALEDGALPQNTALKADGVNENSSVSYDTVSQKLSAAATDKGSSLRGFFAYDVYFADGDGNRVEPNGRVRITFEYKTPAAPELTDAASTSVTVEKLHYNSSTGDTDVNTLQANEDLKVLNVNEGKQIQTLQVETGNAAVFAVMWDSPETADVEAEAVSGNEDEVPIASEELTDGMDISDEPEQDAAETPAAENPEVTPEAEPSEEPAVEPTEAPAENPDAEPTEAPAEDPDVVEEPAEDIASPEDVPAADENGETSLIEVLGDDTNLRVSPSIEAEVLATVNAGTQLTLLDTVTAEDGATWYKVSWEGTEAYIRSDMAQVVDSSDEAEEPEDVQEEEIQPEITRYDYKSDEVNVKVTLTDPADLPDNAELSVTPVELSQEAEDQITEEAIKEKKAIEKIHSYDIKFLVDGEEVQPGATVKVSVSLNDEKKIKDADVYHVDENDNVENMDGSVAKNGDVEFETTHFSTYVIVGNKRDDKIKVTIEHYDATTGEKIYADDVDKELSVGQKFDCKKATNWDIKEVKVVIDGKENTVAAGDIELAQDATVKVYYTPTTGTFAGAPTFYDYTVKAGESGSTYYSINQKSNYSDPDSNQKLSMGETYNGKLADQNYTPYQYTWQKGNKTVNLWTGGKDVITDLLKGLDENGNVEFNYPDPGFFNETDLLAGNSKDNYLRKVYKDYNLNFERSGDTYTLTGVTDGSGTNVTTQYKLNKKENSGEDFFPLDTVASKYEKGYTRKTQSALGNDGKEHNYYFGMRYDMEFNIGDYVGPLNYSFTGDDDMWVVMDGGKENQQIIIDLGGIHNAATKTVNLRDYLDKGDKSTHTLTVLYMERGAGASNCYMNFTLPNVTISQVTTDALGTLNFQKVNKKGAGLSDARFTLYNDEECTTQIATATSDDSGKVTFDKLRAGTYYLKEIQAPVGYVASNEKWTVTVTKENNNVTTTLKNSSGTAVKDNKILNETPEEIINSSMVTSKTAKVKDWDQRTYDITINATSTSTSSIIETKTSVADIMLVLDVSGSMGEDITSYSYTFVANNTSEARDDKKLLNRNVTYYIEVDGSYKEMWYFSYYNKGWRVGPRGSSDDAAKDKYNNCKIYTRTSTTETRLDALKNAVNQFIDDTAKKSPNSKIGITVFSSTDDYNRPYGNHGTSVSLGEVGTADSAKVTELKNFVKDLKANGGTDPAVGLEDAKNKLDAMVDTNPKYVVLFTDGKPTGGGNKWNSNAQKNAETQAGELKTGLRNNVDNAKNPYTVYTIGFALNDEGDRAKTFLSGGTYDGKKYPGIASSSDCAKTADDAASLTQIFQSISSTGFNTADSVECMQIIQKDESTTSGWAFVNGAGACFTEALGMTNSADAQQKVIWGLIKFKDTNVALPTGVTAANVTAANIDLALSKVAALTGFTTLTDKTKIEVSEAGIYAIKAEEEGYTYKTATAYVGFGEPYPALSGTEVIAKKSSTSVDKTTEDADHVVAIGDIVTYTIDAYVPFIDAANTENRTFTITDKITGADYYLTGPNAVNSVTMEGKNGQVGEIVVNDKGNGFTVDLGKLVADTANPNAGKKITVTYTAKVNETTVENKAGSHAAGVDYGGNNVPVKLFTGELVLMKYGDGDINKALEGAEFVLYKDGEEVPLTFVKEEKTGKYKYAPDTKDADSKLVTDANGYIDVEGLDVGSYHFEETKAPKGYSINTDGKTLTLTVDGEVATAKLYNEGGLNDTKLNSLPSTGGMGTYLFTIIGVVVMAGAAGAFFISRRKGSEE